MWIRMSSRIDLLSWRWLFRWRLPFPNPEWQVFSLLALIGTQDESTALEAYGLHKRHPSWRLICRWSKVEVDILVIDALS